MNKTITSNIAGYVFHIDENAFAKLDAYLNTIRSYFSDSQGKDEIIADIEARLAEMLQEKIGSGKQVVTLADVNHVIKIMGQPEAFAEDDPENPAWEKPSEEIPRSGPKRLFRDPDNRIVGGVCAGVSHYLGINDPIWLRLAMVMAVIFFGTGFLLYLILWIIMPQAVTTADKLQMRGENVTVSNIEKRVNEELEAVKSKWNEFHGNNRFGRKAGNALHRLITLVGNLFTMFFKFIVKFIGLAFLLMGALGFLSILALVVSFPETMHFSTDGTVGSVMIGELFSGLFSSKLQLVGFNIAILLAWGIPFLLFAYLGSKLLGGFKNRNRFVLLPLLALWIIGVFTAIGISFSVYDQYSVRSTHTDPQVLQTATGHEVLYLDTDSQDGTTAEGEPFDIMFFNLWAVNDTDLFYGRPTLDISKSPDTMVHVISRSTARGASKKQASDNASDIDYHFKSQDSLLVFNPYFRLKDNKAWRDQSIDLELQIPLGQTIHLCPGMADILYDTGNVNGTSERDMVGRKWIMKNYGLECVDCEGIEPLIHSDDSETDLDQKQQELDEQQKSLDEEKEKLDQEREALDSIDGQPSVQNRNNGEVRPEMAAGSADEILLKRTITATYQVAPNTWRRIVLSYPG